jgi:hydrogen peroxide-dependent heme synthase
MSGPITCWAPLPALGAAEDVRGRMDAVARLDYAELNSAIRYAMWSVFRVEPDRLGDERGAAASQLAEFFEALDGKGVTVRGVYDLAGLRADADYLVWWHADNVEALQAAYADLRRTTALGRASIPVWSQVALHRPAEFNKSHLPAFVAGEEPRRYVCVYPFVRSYEWYLLPDDERRRMLAEHGMAARGYPDVRANTVSSFALGDYEWILAFEADQLDRIVDLMRHLRATDARRHVREETPFFTGPRVEPGDLVATLP